MVAEVLDKESVKANVFLPAHPPWNVFRKGGIPGVLKGDKVPLQCFPLGGVPRGF